MSIPVPAPVPVAADALAAILARRGLGQRAVQRLPHSGSGSTIYLLGEDLVLRVPLAAPHTIARTPVEAVAVPGCAPPP